MSTLNVNRIESASGTAILVPAGYNLEVDGAILNKDTLPPSPAGQDGKFLYTPDGSSLSWSGGAGGYSEKLIDVSSVSSVQVTVGTGSTSWTYYSGAAGGGNTSSFGSYMSATGGRGANTTNQHCGGLPGVGSGGDINLYGGGGTGHMSWACAKGGSSFFGGAGVSGHPQGGNFINNSHAQAAYGCGGTGGYTSYSNVVGAQGRNGVVIVYEYV